MSSQLRLQGRLKVWVRVGDRNKCNIQDLHVDRDFDRAYWYVIS